MNSDFINMPKKRLLQLFMHHWYTVSEPENDPLVKNLFKFAWKSQILELF